MSNPKTMQIEIKGRTVLIDEEDFHFIEDTSLWHITYPRGKNVNYVRRHNNGIFLHRLILNAGKGLVVDHINYNGLDNRRANIRECSVSENSSNRRKPRKPSSTSNYLGVGFYISRGLWRARGVKAGKEYHLGLFKNEIDAAIAYDNWAIATQGEFASTNRKLGLLNDNH
jgi:Cu2+-containing amine oxidase